MEKKCKIVLLPTDKGSIIYKDKSKLYYATNFRFEGSVSQHLYILSDDEIKEGEYQYDVVTEEITKCIKTGIFKDWRKVIATTNPDLIKEGIASIDDHFIKEYCNNPVEEVLVEYEELRGDNIKECGISCNCKSEAQCLVGTYIPKLSPNDSIIIKPVEETLDNIFNNLPENIAIWLEWFSKNYEVPKKK